MNQVALVQLRLGVLAGELHAQFVLRVVQQYFVVAVALVFLRFGARQGFVGGQRTGAAECRREMGAVVEDAGADRAIDVVFDEPDQHFLADARDVLDAPAGPGARVGHAHPGGRLVVKVSAAFRVFLRALPVELHLDAAVFVGEDFLSVWSDDDSRLRAACGRLGVFRRAGRDDGDVSAYGREAVGVELCRCA